MTTATELTPEQLARLDVIESRVIELRSELYGYFQEIDALKQAGIETGEAAEALHDLSDDMSDELRMLRVSRGVSAFSDWWSHRVRAKRSIAGMVEDIPDDAMDDDAVLWRGKYQAALAVDRAIADLDPELPALIDRADALGTERTDMQLQAVLGMTDAQLEDRAEAVLTQVIESGWRP